MNKDNTYGRLTMRELWDNYRAEVWFFLILSACVVLGHCLSHYIPTELFDDVIAPLQNAVTAAVCLFGAYVLFQHADGLRIRTSYAWALVAWGMADAFLILQTYVFHTPVFHLGTEALNAYTMLMGNFLGWLLLVYPTESLRPGWMTWKIALWQLVPMTALVVLDYFIPWDLRWIISLYPILLFVLVCTHIRAYRIWCEENYSSMDHIDVQWIVRYLIMLLVMGISYGYMIVSDNPCRSFTQNILLVFLFGYSIEQILFRKDPWSDVQRDDVQSTKEGVKELADSGQSDDQKKLEEWLAKEKPYLNPDFKLMDLREVLPMNRTYLSQFINDTYGCSFYQFANRFRVEEAKRLMRECPKMKLSDVAAQSGFASPIVFSSVFSKVTGVSPREWNKKCNNS